MKVFFFSLRERREYRFNFYRKAHFSLVESLDLVQLLLRKRITNGIFLNIVERKAQCKRGLFRVCSRIQLSSFVSVEATINKSIVGMHGIMKQILKLCPWRNWLDGHGSNMKQWNLGWNFLRWYFVISRLLGRIRNIQELFDLQNYRAVTTGNFGWKKEKKWVKIQIFKKSIYRQISWNIHNIFLYSTMWFETHDIWDTN